MNETRKIDDLSRLLAQAQQKAASRQEKAPKPQSAGMARQALVGGIHRNPAGESPKLISHGAAGGPSTPKTHHSKGQFPTQKVNTPFLDSPDKRGTKPGSIVNKRDKMARKNGEERRGSGYDPIQGREKTGVRTYSDSPIKKSGKVSHAHTPKDERGLLAHSVSAPSTPTGRNGRKVLFSPERPGPYGNFSTPAPKGRYGATVRSAHNPVNRNKNPYATSVQHTDQSLTWSARKDLNKKFLNR